MSARYLRRDGLRVRLVTTPEQALAELTAGPDAAAVLDLTMPGLDPRRIRRALRTPVIFLVAGRRAPGRVAWPAAGPAGPRRWLARPFGPRQLVAMVREVLAIPVPLSATSGPPRLASGEPVKLTATETAVLSGPARPAGARAVPPPAARRRGSASGRGPGR